MFDRLWSNADQSREIKPERFRTLTIEVCVTPTQARRGGQVQVELPVKEPCSQCHGRGELGSFECWRCGGSGMALNRLSLLVEYPPGIHDFYRVAIPLDRDGIPGISPILRFRVGSDRDLVESFRDLH